MKGLWVKDWLLLKAQWLAAVITFVLAWGALIVFRQTGIVVGMGIASLTMAFVMLATVSADQADHGLSFLLTLPVTATEYISQKFALLISVICATTVVITALALLYRGYARWSLSVSTLLAMCASVALVIFLILSITMSYQLRHGAEKAQVAMSMVGGIVALLIGGGIAAVRYTDWGPKVWAHVVTSYTQHGGLSVIGILIVLALAVGIAGRRYARPLAQ